MNLLQDKDKGFSGIELAIVIAVLSIFSAVAIPAFNCVRRRAISTAAQETIKQIKEECETNYIYGINKFTSSNPDKYQITSSGSNSCSGGTVTLTPEDTSLYPTYLYKFEDSELSYNFKGQTGTSYVACNKLICGNSEENLENIILDYDFVMKEQHLDLQLIFLFESRLILLKSQNYPKVCDLSKKSQLVGCLSNLIDRQPFLCFVCYLSPSKIET